MGFDPPPEGSLPPLVQRDHESLLPVQVTLPKLLPKAWAGAVGTAELL